MKLDDLARRAADEVREASREARYSVRSPASRPSWARPVAVFGAVALVLAIGVPLVLLYGPWVKPITHPPVTTATTMAGTTTAATTTAPTTTTVVTSTTATTKTPVAEVLDLVTAYYAAGDAGDWGAFLALSTDECMYAAYNVRGRAGQVSQNISCADYAATAEPLEGIEVVGAFMASGGVVVVPVAYAYPDPTGVLTGFDVLMISRVEGGLLVGGAASFLSDDQPDLVTDPTEARTVIEASASAFNADDIEGMLGFYDADAALWEYVPDVTTIKRGTATLRAFFTERSFFTTELTGEPVTSGRFVAVQSRHTVEGSGESYEGVYIFWIGDGKIVLQAYAQTA